MNIVLDLGANIECNEKNLIDFSFMGSHCINHYLKMRNKSSFINIGSEELKGNNTIKNTYQILNEKKFIFEFNGYIEEII